MIASYDKENAVNNANTNNSGISRVDKLKLWKSNKSTTVPTTFKVSTMKKSASSASISQGINHKRKVAYGSHEDNSKRIRLQSHLCVSSSIPSSPTRSSINRELEEIKETFTSPTLLQSIKKKLKEIKTPLRERENNTFRGLSRCDSMVNLPSLASLASKPSITDSQQRLKNLSVWREERNQSKAKRNSQSKATKAGLVDRRAKGVRDANENIAVSASVSEVDILCSMGRYTEARDTMKELVLSIAGATSKHTYWLALARIEEADGNLNTGLEILKEALLKVDGKLGVKLIEGSMLNLQAKIDKQINIAKLQEQQTKEKERQETEESKIEDSNTVDGVSSLSLLVSSYAQEEEDRETLGKDVVEKEVEESCDSPDSQDSWTPIKTSSSQKKLMLQIKVNVQEIDNKKAEESESEEKEDERDLEDKVEEEQDGKKDDDVSVCLFDAAEEFHFSPCVEENEIMEEKDIVFEDEKGYKEEKEEESKEEEQRDIEIVEEEKVEGNEVEVVAKEEIKLVAEKKEGSKSTSINVKKENILKTLSSSFNPKYMPIDQQQMQQLGSKVVLSKVPARASVAMELGVNVRDLILSPCRRATRLPGNNVEGSVSALLKDMDYNYAPNYALSMDGEEDVFEKFLQPSDLAPISEKKSHIKQQLLKVEEEEEEDDSVEGKKLDFENVMISPPPCTAFTNKTNPPKRKHTPRPPPKDKQSNKVRDEEFAVPLPRNVSSPMLPPSPMRRSSRLSSTPASLRKKIEELLL